MPELLVKPKKDLESNYIKKFPCKIFYYIGGTTIDCRAVVCWKLNQWDDRPSRFLRISKFYSTTSFITVCCASFHSFFYLNYKH